MSCNRGIDQTRDHSAGHPTRCPPSLQNSRRGVGKGPSSGLSVENDGSVLFRLPSMLNMLFLTSLLIHTGFLAEDLQLTPLLQGIWKFCYCRRVGRVVKAGSRSESECLLRAIQSCHHDCGMYIRCWSGEPINGIKRTISHNRLG